MPQLMVAALLGAGLYAGYRWVARAARQMADDARARADRPGPAGGTVTKDLGMLELDPVSGVYRPGGKREQA